MENRPDSIYLNSRRVCSDECARETKDLQNDGMFKYTMYQDLKVQCDDNKIRFPNCAWDHVNLTGRTGYGLSDACAVDNYSSLRNDQSQLTRDRCPIQLYTRIFQGCPNLRIGTADPDVEMPILQGTGPSTLEGTVYACKKTLTEKTTYNFPDLIGCVKEVQNPKHIIDPYTRGGIDTRSYVRRQEMLRNCETKQPRRNMNGAVGPVSRHW